MANVRASSVFDWRAAMTAGVIGGIIFVVLEMIMVPAFLGGSPWDPPMMIGAIILGSDVLPAPGVSQAVNPWVIAVGAGLHLALSAFYGLVLGLLLQRATGLAPFIGIAFGLFLYFVNFYGFTAFFPWFAMARNWVSIVSHGVFGLTAAVAYMGLRKGEPVREAGPAIQQGDRYARTR